MFQQPFTLRRIAAAGMPIFRAPRASASLFALGATSQGVVDRRVSIRVNHGARSSTPYPESPNSRCQNASLAGGVRKQLVQLTVVPPPTQRPWRMLIALSRVLRAADSWYNSGYAFDSCIRK